MSIKALFTYNYGKENMKKIENLGYDITIINEKEIKYKDQIKDMEVLVCYNPFSTLDISLMKSLKWIQLSSTGVDQVPKDIVLKNNVIVTNNNGGYSIPIAEWIVLKTLELLKNSKEFYKKQENKTWKLDTSLLELCGKTIGFIGTGSIAKEAAKRFSGFNVNILGVNTKGRDVEYFNKCYSKDNIKEMVSKSDIIILSIPYTKETENLVDENVLNSMKNGALFINISRGSIVDERKLIENLKLGKIKGAALDVFEEEPLFRDNPIWELDNAIITPHNSWISEKRNIRRFDIIYENLKNYKEGTELKSVVNMNKGY
ncbi:D-isomer-specific NAD-dependent 2-hydroxyacid dehydrogenase [Clostridium sporogenes]|uniref:phosphoglycerate dehydrogenase n=1 Tax=Clostridium botulinum TaxID=1491 RepID=UPI00071766B9|nr:phosphoglycerate dehydrogenase [Clostridium botulinum]KRU26311.1 D-isomer-specific NAD-dependent 2-hydroxyacid dehydrogenase [Clostridium sporogenes]KRU26968.1 D-isomer-specific NAD-dependent 2-hydroxyacid dehydrogenase [Clostridium sporogenes]KRU29935.1 D-isomer-specific NAD-dependent 2-hydroxyacid dehydrogenase [Clostridium sporogenes]KRU44425.1 D-isomer-specific NAD-dependent 2-hydroxyacid dehydrogenase [Clostridium sporogenes]MBZ1329128.1 NAD(P)-binding domain-containing protein [Clostr